MRKFAVVTTINGKTPAIKKLERLGDWRIVVVGDVKTPDVQESNNLKYLSIDKQKNLGFSFVDCCPLNHYSRKNIGFLYAIHEGADVIFDMDDDNTPSNLWSDPSFSCNLMVKTKCEFVNIYKHFTNYHIWPRGLPLDEVFSGDFTTIKGSTKKLGVLQSMSNRAPDVDAIYRLTVGDSPFYFSEAPTIYLPKGVYSPFNSQCSFWTREAFPYLYLPTNVRFRYTDILRGYLAQYLMWKRDLCVGFCNACITQDRNEHNYMTDFESELNVYTDIKSVIKSIQSAKDIKEAYSCLVSDNLVGDKEITSINAWVEDTYE